MVLLLADHVGDMAVIAEAVAAARDGIPPDEARPDLSVTA
ncbi:DUF2783 domain-containing protein [Phreatobacter sp. AB_2022a]|nr:DUF2783 domain-containing protein [Phreatobacter sp. AB_2022a]MCZ0736172.1 DUF2783 domain-containing protein [Phreatobacter sp. AB_2022a]